MCIRVDNNEICTDLTLWYVPSVSSTYVYCAVCSTLYRTYKRYIVHTICIQNYEFHKCTVLTVQCYRDMYCIVPVCTCNLLPRVQNILYIYLYIPVLYSIYTVQMTRFAVHVLCIIRTLIVLLVRKCNKSLIISYRPLLHLHGRNGKINK